VGGGVTATVVVALDRDDESGEVSVADDLPKLLLGFEHAGGAPVRDSDLTDEERRFARAQHDVPIP
jgi:hypothetical protein